MNVYAIDVLARRGYLQMTPRGSLERPTILLMNQHSLSDAEDFS